MKRNSIYLCLALACIVCLGSAKPFGIGLHDKRSGIGWCSAQNGSAPEAPTNFTAVVNSNKVDLTWDEVEGAQYYRVYRSFGGTYKNIAVTNSNDYSDTGMVFGSPHNYTVAAVASGGSQSTMSQEQSVWPVNKKTFRTPFYYTGQWGDYPTQALTSAQMDSLAQFDAVGFAAHGLEGPTFEPAYVGLADSLRAHAALPRNGEHDMVILMYAHCMGPSFWWAREDDPVTWGGTQYKWPDTFQGRSSLHPRLWDWLMADQSRVLRKPDGSINANFGYPAASYNYANYEVADTVACWYADAFDASGYDGTAGYCGIFIDFINSGLQNWTADLSVVDLDGDGIMHGAEGTTEAIDEDAIYREFHLRMLKAFRRRFAERGMDNRLLIANGNGAMSYDALSTYLDGVMIERWNETGVGWPAWSSVSASDRSWATTETQVSAWEGALTNWFAPARWPHAQTEPHGFMWHAWADSNVSQFTAPLAVLSNGWVHGNTIGRNPLCTGTSEYCYSVGANGESWIQPPITRWPDAGDVTSWDITGYPQGNVANADTLNIYCENYNIRLVLKPRGAVKYGVWPYFAYSGLDTIARGGGWPRQDSTPPVGAPVASFTGTPTSGTIPLSVSFTDASTNTPTSWAWTFGDGGTSTAQNPSHQYTTAGIYSVSLTATNASGSDDYTRTNYIVANQPLPVAAFSGTPTSGAAPLNVTFTDATTNSPTSWAWAASDGWTSTSQNPSHSFTSAGTYTVGLTATNSYGSDAEVKVDYITVTAGQAPVAAFSANTTACCEGTTVTFTDASTNTPTSWAWTFGDGGTSTSQSPSHEYTTAGTYNVALTATNSYGSDSETKTGYIVVSSCDVTISEIDAADSIIEDEVTYTIQGLGFGTKTTAAPQCWERFETGATQDANVPAAAGRFDTVTCAAYSAPTSLPQFNAGSAVFGSYGAKITTTDPGNYSVWMTVAAPFRDMYLDYWWRVEVPAGLKPRQFKPVVVWGVGEGLPNFDFAVPSSGCAENDPSMIAYQYKCDSSGNPYVYTGKKLSEFVAAPVHVQIAFHQASVGGSDGWWKVWYDGEEVAYASGRADGCDLEETLYYCRIGQYETWEQDCDNGVHAADRTAHYDDIYIDNSLARVELGDASTYGACTQRAIQLPISWSDQQIMFQSNWGPFTAETNTTLYLYVTDSLGNVSNGLAVYTQ